MLGRLLKRLFGGKGAGRETPSRRPVSPAPPSLPGRTTAGASMPPPPPPPPLPTAAAEPAARPAVAAPAAAPIDPPAPVAAQPTAPEPPSPETQEGAPQDPETPISLKASPAAAPSVPVDEVAALLADAEASLAGGGRVKLVLDDGTLATPALDEELADRLRYIVDNIVTPPEQPST